MSWRSQLRPASFRGVPFGVVDVENEGGRRTVLHEVPMLDDPFVEDMGKSSHKITITGFVLGVDYLSRAKALFDALEQEGSGTLVHPYFGEVNVALAATFKCKQTAQDGGMAVFTMSFVRCIPAQNPSASPNPQKIAGERSLFGQEVSITSFADAIETAKAAGTALQNIYSAATEAAGIVQKVISGDVSTITGLLGIDISTPMAFARGLFSQISSFSSSSFSSGQNRYSPAKGYNTSLPAPVGQRYFAAAQAVASAAPLRTPFVTPAYTAVQQACVINGCNSLAVSVPQSRAQAAVWQRNVINAVQQVLECETTPDAVFSAFTDLRAATVAAIAHNAGNAPDVITVQPHCVMPSLALVYMYTGNITLEADFVTRNALVHPSFVQVQPLEVLRRG